MTLYQFSSVILASPLTIHHLIDKDNPSFRNYSSSLLHCLLNSEVAMSSILVVWPKVDLSAVIETSISKAFASFQLSDFICPVPYWLPSTAKVSSASFIFTEASLSRPSCCKVNPSLHLVRAMASSVQAFGPFNLSSSRNVSASILSQVLLNSFSPGLFKIPSFLFYNRQHISYIGCFSTRRTKIVIPFFINLSGVMDESRHTLYTSPSQFIPLFHESDLLL
jgi:hypothetical protein